MLFFDVRYDIACIVPRSIVMILKSEQKKKKKLSASPGINDALLSSKI